MTTQPLRTRRDYGTLSPEEFQEALKSAKHETGKSVPLEKLPEELQENVKNPPESVLNLKEEMQTKKAGLSDHVDYLFEAMRSEGDPRKQLALAKELKTTIKTFNKGHRVWGYMDEAEDTLKGLKGQGIKAGETIAAAKGLTTHLEDPKKPGFNLCGEKTYPDTVVDSVKDATCYYCKQAWNKSHGMHQAKFERGETVPVEDLPLEVQKNITDPPESVQKVKEDMQDKKAAVMALTAADYASLLTAKFEKDKPMSVDEVAEVVGPEFKEHNENPSDAVKQVKEDMQAKTAGAGLYGSTRDTETCCNSSIKKLKSAATKMAKEIYGKDEESPAFLSEHSKRTGSKSAKLLVAALKDLGPKVASGVKTAAGKRGLYGFKERTAKIALHACTALHHQAGLIASDLHDRRANSYDGITGFLKEHSKTAKCGYSSLLLDSYPSNPVVATALPGSTPKKASDPTWYSEASKVADNAPTTTADILAWEESVSHVATDFLASKEEPEEAKETKTADAAVTRARVFVRHLMLLASGDFEGTRLTPIESIRALIFILKMVEQDPKNIGPFVADLSDLMTLKLRPVL